MENEEEKVNHPKHYNSHPSGIECITIVEHFNFNIGNAIKYIWRAGLKSSSSSVEDLKKAVWYINREIDRIDKSKTLPSISYPQNYTPITCKCGTISAKEHYKYCPSCQNCLY